MSSRLAVLALGSLAMLGTLAVVACSSSDTPAPAAAPEEDAGEKRVSDAGKPTTVTSPLPGCPSDPGPPKQTVDAASKTDPTGGAESFTLEQALAGYTAKTGVLTALITTEKSTIRCTLDEKNAPVSVANFVGLARGTRPFKKDGKWQVGRFYDGLIWHRVIPDFVIQGGDPLGKGTGGPGYDLVKENQVEEPLGTMAMAASSKVSGSQFYIVVGQGPEASYNVFGSCSTETAIKIAAEPRDEDDKPLTDVHMTRIDIARCPE